MTRDWKHTEKLVQLLERSLSPYSHVEHNLLMPVITHGNGLKRQCDIVIFSGKPPRQTTAIVEVQDRNKAVDANTFGGWLEKLKEVGAQQLICVSKNEFPISIKEKARALGDTVKLMVLKSFEGLDSLPVRIFEHEITFTEFEINNVRSFSVAISDEELRNAGLTENDLSNRKGNTEEKIFSRDREEMLSIYALCKEYFEFKNFEFTDVAKIEFAGTNDLFIFLNENYVRVDSLQIEFSWFYRNHIITPTVLSYEQVGDGEIAWVVELKLEKKDKKFWFKLPIVSDGNRYLLCKPEAITNFGVELNIGIFPKTERI